MKSVAIIWDLENIKPPSQNNFFIEKLLEYASAFGRLIYAKAYCDWTNPAFKKMGLLLARHYFYMVHVPSERKKKNSVDIQLVSDTLESINFYSHIDTFILMTGDSDFRSLVLALRRAGKSIYIICDVHTAADSLIELCDGFIDYRDLMVVGEGTEDNQYDSEKITLDQWMNALYDILQLMVNRGRSTTLSAVKVSMGYFHPQFDEKKLGFSRWSDFIEMAARQNYVTIVGGEGESPTTLLPTDRKKDHSDPLEKALGELKDILKSLDAENNGKPSYHLYSLVNLKLRERRFDLAQIGFSRFKKFAQIAELKGLIEVKVEGIHYQMKLKT